MPASNRPNMASDSRATTLPRMTSHFDLKFPEQIQHSMNRPVVISENDVDRGMLNPVTTASMRVARSSGEWASGEPVSSQSKRLSGVASKCGFVDKEAPCIKVG